MGNRTPVPNVAALTDDARRLKAEPPGKQAEACGKVIAVALSSGEDFLRKFQQLFIGRRFDVRTKRGVAPEVFIASHIVIASAQHLLGRHVLRRAGGDCLVEKHVYFFASCGIVAVFVKQVLALRAVLQQLPAA